ncbi:GIY-YIG nuclease family protein [Paenibacillus sp. N3.4]|uniref:GIY-YIG nuclease family protein n=1 Tax=Paenibacillus sp. N3.4 TaxID=2603222 RepID=UPI0011CCB1B5|nr:GIY-YIG nuclease family protein [Paenibacillus sp. N3.4]TXK83551.1 hypothetical protein FU659_13330 [Paenibacillus sp. N3.4]
MEILRETAEKIYESIEKDLKIVSKEEIINTDGKLRIGHETAKKGSFVYMLFNEVNTLLYVGETGTSIKRRMISDGSGAHKFKNPKMFNETVYIKYLLLDHSKLSENERRFIEQAISIHKQPKYYSNTE